jgi:hypothetical protein
MTNVIVIARDRSRHVRGERAVAGTVQVLLLQLSASAGTAFR